MHNPELDEAIAEGEADTTRSLQLLEKSLLTLSVLLEDLWQVGRYVPASLPPPGELVLLIAVHAADQSQTRSVHCRDGSLLSVWLAEHTGQSIRDLDAQRFEDTWDIGADALLITDCAKEAVYWLPLPPAWETVRYQGVPGDFYALSCPDTEPVFSCLGVGEFATPEAVTPPALGMPVSIRYAPDWQTA